MNDRVRLHHYNQELYPIEFLATAFQHRWQKYFISRDWQKPETTHEKSVAPQGLTKRTGQEIRHDLVSANELMLVQSLSERLN